MKLKKFSQEKAMNFVILWTILFFLLGLMVTWSLIEGYKIQRQYPAEPISVFWPHTFLMFLALLSLLMGVAGMWITFLSGKFEKIRKARNIAFIVVLFLYPLSLIINLIVANLH